MSVDFVSTLMSKQRQEDDFNLFSDEQLGSVNLESFPPVGCSFGSQPETYWVGSGGIK